MERRDLRRRLHLSGIDGSAAALAKAWDLGFEITEFCWAPRLEQPDAMALVRRQIQGAERLWLHAPFAELSPCAIDPLVRDAALRRFRQTIQAAQVLGVTRIVVHGGYIPLVYFPEWFVEQSVRFWRELLSDVPEGMTLAVENVMEPEPRLLADIAAQVDDPRLGLCLDVGHANSSASKTPPLEWIAPMSPWLRHVHLHNNEGGWDLHAPLGQGTVPMEQVLDTVLAQCPAATFTIENQNCVPSLQWLAQRGYLEEAT